MKIEQKKSAVDLTELAIGIVVLGIVVSVGAVIVHNVATSQVTNLPTYTVVNESITGVTAIPQTLSTGWVKSIDSVTNETGSQIINSANFTTTINSEGVGTIASTTNGLYNNSNWDVTYTVYNQSDPRFLVPQKAELGLAEYGSWFKIIVIVGIAAIILAIIFMAFGNRTGGNSGSSAGVGY